ncbi:MAG: 50S ribosomal protein L10 [Planctomycetes bacterium]|nr:50S ribosomal protein L10 [Planctomycetota bacterium]
MPSELKAEVARELADRFRPAAGYVFVSFTGLSAAQSTGLRRLLREHRADMDVVKNRIYSKALEMVGAEGLVQTDRLRKILKGPTAIVRGEEGPISAARAVAAWRKKNPGLEIKGGILDGRVISDVDVEGLAQIPDRPVLLSRVVGSFAAPVAGFPGVLAGLVRKLVYALRAIEGKKGGEDGSAESGH